MKRALCYVLLHVALVGAVAAQQTAQTPAWDVTLKTNTVADSNLEVVNRCKKNHQFQIQLSNLPFLHFSSTQVNVKGGAKQLVPVKFDTRNMMPGVYQGTVLVICLSCKSEATCTQDREVLQVVLRVTSESPATPPGAATTNPPTSPPTTNQAATTQPAPPLGNPQGSGASGIMLSPVPEAIAEALANALKKKERVEAELAELRAAAAAAQEAADKARQAAETAEQDARKAQAEVDAAQKAKDDAVKAVNEANQAVAAAEAALAKAISEGTTSDRAAARSALEKARADLAAALKILKDAQAAIAAGKMQAAAVDAAKKAREKKAEADKAAAALAAAQAAVAEKEKELLKAQQEAAAAQAARDKAEQEAREREAAKAATEKAAQEKMWAEDIERRRQAETDRADRAVEIEYLLNNIEALGLITYKPKTNVPDPLDYVFDTLRQLTGQTVGDFLQTVAGEVGGGPIPGNVVGALAELAKSLGSFFDVRTKAGKDIALEKLQNMINPNVQPPRKYTMNEALAKIDKMEALMRELQKKLTAAQAAAGK
jgi:chemotaxis protein histidine kinase CheA